jgi:hypothetical protein
MNLRVSWIEAGVRRAGGKAGAAGANTLATATPMRARAPAAPARSLILRF